ncbi:hypothetical protein GGF31_005511 [Allomyces arbusculus]|nr:hypothetical protein GGF31_005511 [Allomyces arbusculus]
MATTEVYPSGFNPKDLLFSPNTPAADLVTGYFNIDFARAISDRDRRAEFADQPTSVHYRIHWRTNFVEVIFCPPPGDIEYTLHIRELGYDGSIADEEFAAREPPHSVGRNLPTHLKLRSAFICDHYARFDASPPETTQHLDDLAEYKRVRALQYGSVKHDARGILLPVMDLDQHVRMIETILVTVFDYMLAICTEIPDGAAVLKYALEHVQYPDHSLTHWPFGFLGYVHQLACRWLLDLRWCGPDRIRPPVSVVEPRIEYCPPQSKFDGAYMMEDLGRFAVRTDDDDDGRHAAGSSGDAAAEEEEKEDVACHDD